MNREENQTVLETDRTNRQVHPDGTVLRNDRTGEGSEFRTVSEAESLGLEAGASQLARAVLDQLDELDDAVLKFPRRPVESAAREANAAICLLSATLRADLPYQVLDPNLFFAVTTDTNHSESALNADPWANAHVHWCASEVYLPLKGRMRLYAWRGRKRLTYEAGPGDVLRVRAGVPHKVEIEPGAPALVYIVRAPAAVADYKQSWPPKT